MRGLSFTNVRRKYLRTKDLVDHDTVPTIPVNMSEMSPVVKTTIDGINASYTALVDLGGQRAVVAVDGTYITYADKDTLTHEGNVIGITTGAIATGDKGVIHRDLNMTEPSWTWTPLQTIFLGNNGLLTQTVPTTGFILSLGQALSSTVMYIDLGISIELV